jgi:hypothetical protein
MFRPERWGLVHIQRQSSHVINSQLRWGLRSKNSRPGELTASGAHDLASKEKRDSVHYGGTSCIPSPPNGSQLRWRHLTEILRSACWTMMVSSIRSHLRVTRTGPTGSTLGVRATSISSRPIGATGVNSTSRCAEQPRKLQDGTCESSAICWRGRQRFSARTPLTRIVVALVLAAIARWPTARTTQLTYSSCDPQNISFRQPAGRPPNAEIAQKRIGLFKDLLSLLWRMSP